jgi:hypothetical protein
MSSAPASLPATSGTPSSRGATTTATWNRSGGSSKSNTSRDLRHAEPPVTTEQSP